MQLDHCLGKKNLPVLQKKNNKQHLCIYGSILTWFLKPSSRLLLDRVFILFMKAFRFLKDIVKKMVFRIR